MKTAVAIRHVPFEDLGTLEPLLQERGYAVRYLDIGLHDPHAPAAEEADLLVVLGGPIGAFDDDTYPFVADEVALVRRRLDAGRPLLGICLGAQLMARAAGAAVTPMHAKEIGFAPLLLTAEGRLGALGRLPPETPVLHWHGDRFDLPAFARRLACTAHCPQQAFEIGEHALALQFHLEADPHRIEQWLVGHAAELGAAGIDPRELRRQAAECAEQLLAASRAVFGAWLDGLPVAAAAPRA